MRDRRNVIYQTFSYENDYQQFAGMEIVLDETVSLVPVSVQPVDSQNENNSANNHNNSVRPDGY